jgi:hypothetical protein
MGGYYAHGALGMGPLDARNQSAGNAPAENQGGNIEAQGRRAKAMLLEPQPMYRT